MYKNLEGAVKALHKGVPFSDRKFDYLRNNKYLAKEVMSINVTDFIYLPEELRGDKELALNAVKLEPNMLWCLTEELKDDHNIVLTAINKDGLSIRHASDRLKEDFTLISKALKKNSAVVNYLPQKITDFFKKYEDKDPQELISRVLKLQDKGVLYDVDIDIEMVEERVAINEKLTKELSGNVVKVQHNNKKI